MNPRPQERRDDDLVERVVAGLLDQPDPMARYQALTRAQEMYDAVTKRIGAERARAVADMKQAGLSYGEIAEAIGFTRSRAQQLVERAEPAARPSAAEPARKSGAPALRRLADFLEDYLREHRWPREPASSVAARSTPVPPLMAQRYSAEQLAAELFADSKFRALQLGTWLRAPDARLIADAVEALSPPPYRQDAALLVDGLTLAAQLQQDDGRSRAVATGVVLAFLGALSVAGRS